jgi:hypothetical protein
LILAALCTNGWFSRCAAAPNFTLTQHFRRCERTQQENRTHRLGSLLPFSTLQHHGGSDKVASSFMVHTCRSLLVTALQCSFPKAVIDEGVQQFQ